MDEELMIRLNKIKSIVERLEANTKELEDKNKALHKEIEVLEKSRAYWMKIANSRHRVSTLMYPRDYRD